MGTVAGPPRPCMHAILDFAEFIIQGVLTLMLWVVIAYAILSWLVAFNVVNLRNRAVWQISRGLEFSPILLFLVIGGAQRFLIPAFFNFLHNLVGPPLV